MLKTIGRAMIALAVGAGSAAALGGGDFTITVVNPDNNQPVMNQADPREPERGEKPRRPTDENGKLTLPGTFMGKSAALRCSSVPLLFNTRETLEDGMTVVLSTAAGRRPPRARAPRTVAPSGSLPYI